MRSFSKRLTRRIVIALMLTMALITVGVFYQASWIMGLMTNAYYSHVADIENESVEKRLRYVQVAAQNSIDEVEWQLSDPDSVFVALADKLKLNPDVVLGFGVGFVPDYYPQKGRWFEPYAMWRDGKVVTSQNGSAEDDYLYEEWYVEGLATDSCYWSDPYYMKVGDDSVMICTYAVPLRDAQRRKVGVFGADLSLEMLHNYLLKKDLKANTEGLIKITRKHEGDPKQWVRSIIVGKHGYYISHPDATSILRDNFFSEVTQQGDTTALRMVSDMQAGKKGVAEIEVKGVPSTVFYTPLERTGWSLAVILPDERFKRVVIDFCIYLSIFLIIGVLAVYLISLITIRHATSPLHTLAKSADEVARGNFNAPLPELKHDDEIRQLRDSFSNMQQSLMRYIDELQTTTAQKSAIESELAIARNIQMSMLPAGFPERQGINLHAMLTPAKAVGGDFYDYMLNGHSLYFCIGDVSGKGMPAALVMATARGSFRMQAEDGVTPLGIITRMNSRLTSNNRLSVFITLFVGVLDLETGRLSYCNAGHKVPYIDGQPLDVKHNLPVGAIPDWTFEAQETTLAPGAMLFLYTDGLDEAEDTAHNMFGKARIKEVLQTTAKDPQTLIEHMKQAVADFTGDAEQSDDLTMLAIVQTYRK